MTLSEEINELMQSYWAWLKDSTYLRNIDDRCVAITTPYLDRHNDNYQIYVSKKGDGYELTDDGYIIDDLMMSGCDVSSGRRKEYLDTIARSYGITIDGNQLKVRSDASDFASCKHDLIQAMQAVNDLYYVSRPNVVSLFHEDVSEWLIGSGIHSTSRVIIRGRTYYHHVDFVLSDKSSNGPKRILQTMDKPAKDKMANLLMMKTDIKEKIEMYVFLNDTDAGEKRIGSLQQFGEECGIKTMLWSQRDAYTELLS